MKFSFRLCNVDACNAKIKTVLDDLDDDNRFRREWGSTGSVSTNRFDACVACPKRTLSVGWKFTPPKRRFWKAEPTFPNVFSKHFSRA